MATFSRVVSCSLGDTYTGLAGSVGYRVLSYDGTTLVARTTAGVAEVGSSGSYYANVASWDSSWRGVIAWDYPAATYLAIEDFTPEVLNAAGLDGIAVETGVNARQALAVMAAALAGTLSGGGTTTITIKGVGVATTRITATVDSSNNRTAVVTNLPV